MQRRRLKHITVTLPLSPGMRRNTDATRQRKIIKAIYIMKLTDEMAGALSVVCGWAGVKKMDAGGWVLGCAGGCC